MRIGFLVTALAFGFSANGLSAQQALPPLHFADVEAFLDAVDADALIARPVDMVWTPLTKVLVEANPGKPAEARAFALRYRSKELSAYRPIVAFSLDHDLVQTLYPEVAQRVQALTLRPRTPQELTVSQAEYRKITEKAARKARIDLPPIVRLARTTDGVALQALAGKLPYCLPRYQPQNVIYANPSASARRRAECASVLTSPTLTRLRSRPHGEQLIMLSTEAHLQIQKMFSLSHDAGFSTAYLLPPKELAAAGLNMPANVDISRLAEKAKAYD